MNTTILSGSLFSAMVRGGAAQLSRNRTVVNELNVFPIPDGDTGDNMYMTMDAGACAGERCQNAALSDVSEQIAKGMLLGARGNSGVILSRIFAGISRGLSACEQADLSALGAAFAAGIDEAYSAVSEPVEGTILTVYKDAVLYANGRIRDGSTLESFFDDLLCELRRSLERTPSLLAVLREAGVVDSGGAGFVYIAEGMQAALQGALPDAEAPVQEHKTVDLSSFNENSELEFGYCTEFLLQLLNSKIDVASFDEKDLIGWLNENGESVVAFREGSIVKVHIHTMRPGDILSHVQQYGEFLTLKIENMMLQHNETTIRNNFAPVKPRPHKAYATVAVASGDGMKETFLSLGTDQVIEGGQSMNPPAEDFVRAFEALNADTVLVFPNNGNVILTAHQAASLFDGADVRVIPTKDVGQGYAALSMLDVSSGDTDTIIEELTQIAAEVVTGMVASACRDTEKDGICIRKGDYLGFAGDVVYTAQTDAENALCDLAQKLNAGDYDIAILIYGKTADAKKAQAACDRLAKAYPRTEFILLDGGQPVYEYLLILE